MHLLIPFASSDAPGCAEALRGLRLPHLEALLQRLVLVETDAGAAGTLSPPHERALARLQGLGAADGCIAWAALEARQAGLGDVQAPWAWISPVHWRVGAHHIDMTDPQALALTDEESRALMAAMRPYFTEDGITLEYAAPHRWLAQGAVFDGLSCAALDRVVGRDIQDSMPARPALRRLQNEMQMLLYTHPVNDARAAGSQTTVNSFWVSGAGRLPPAAAADLGPDVQTDRSLRDPAVQGNWAAWAQCWVDLDRTACKDLLDRRSGSPGSRLTLCGERSALMFGASHDTLLRRLQRRWKPITLQSLQASL